MEQMVEQLFKECPSCRKKWYQYSDLLADPAIRLIGYQVFFEELSGGLFLFNHDCGTTLSITVEALQHLYHGPRYGQRMTGGAKCPGFCLVKKETRPCPAKCECAYVRGIMQLIKTWPKTDENDEEAGMRMAG